MGYDLIGTAIFITADIAITIVVWKMLGKKLPLEERIKAAWARVWE